MFDELTLLERSGIALALILMLMIFTRKAYRTTTFSGTLFVMASWFLILTALLIFPIILVLNIADGANVLIALFSWIVSIICVVIFWDKRRKR